MESITPEQLKQRMDAGDGPKMLDVREPWEFEICRIEGSVNIPMAELGGRFGELEHGSEIVVICHHGMRSRQVAEYMESIGFPHVVNLEGGVDAWAQSVDEDMQQY